MHSQHICLYLAKPDPHAVCLSLQMLMNVNSILVEMEPARTQLDHTTACAIQDLN